MTKAILFGSVILAATLGTLGLAQAGQKLTYGVTVNTGSRYALGALGIARNTANTVEYIGCQTYFYASGSPTVVSCSATDSAGVGVACTSSDQQMIAAVNRLQGDSLLRFDWDASGFCTAITVANTSQHAPKAP